MTNSFKDKNIRGLESAFDLGYVPGACTNFGVPDVPGPFS